MLANAPRIIELHNLLSVRYSMSATQMAKGYYPRETCTLYLYNAMIWIKCNVPVYGVLSLLSPFILFLVFIKRDGTPAILYYHVRIYKKSLQPRGKVSLVLVETKLARPVGHGSPPIFAALRSLSSFIGMSQGSCAKNIICLFAIPYALKIWFLTSI
jgi:hypothetical protein